MKKLLQTSRFRAVYGQGACKNTLLNFHQSSAQVALKDSEWKRLAPAASHMLPLQYFRIKVAFFWHP